MKKMQNGATLYYAVTIMMVMLAISMGLSTVILMQVKNINAASSGVIASAAAYSGVEKGLYLYYKPNTTPKSSQCGEGEYRTPNKDGVDFYLNYLHGNSGANYRWFCYISPPDATFDPYTIKKFYIKGVGDYNGVRKPVSGEW